MRQLITILLLLGFAVYTFQQAATVINYYANVDAYAQKCVNKSKPVMKCHGRCQMEKNLKSQEAGSAHPSLKQSSPEPLVIPSLPASSDLIRPLFVTVYPTLLPGQLRDCASSLFHPPLAV